MEYRELLEKYIKVFIMVLQIASDKTGNSIYRDVESIVKENYNLVDWCVEHETAFPEVIAHLIVLLLTRIHGDSVVGLEGKEYLNNMIEDLYIRYLKSPSNAFFKKYGLPSVNSLIEIGYMTIYKK